MDALLAWLKLDRRLKPDLNRFQVLVSDDGDTRLEPALAAVATTAISPPTFASSTPRGERPKAAPALD